MPGMVLYTNHNRLSFINKETGKSYLYCFDPLCDHGDNCITNTNPYTLYYYWSMIDDCLYATQFNLETAGNDGNFYRIDPNTQEMEQVFHGNGNEFFTIYVNEQYFFFERALKDGGYEIIQFDPMTEKATTMTPPQGKTFSMLYVAGDTILVGFMDEPYVYVTNDEFVVYQNTTLVGSDIDYIDGSNVYSVTRKETSSDATARNTMLTRYNLKTKEKKVLLAVDDDTSFIATIAFDGNYIYYRLNTYTPTADGHWKRHRGTLLYRISVDGGESEPMIDFSGAHTGLEYDMYAYAAACYDGVIYCNLSSDNSPESVDIFGTITQGDDGVWVYQNVEAGD